MMKHVALALLLAAALGCQEVTEPAPAVVRSVLTQTVEAPGGDRQRVFSGVAQAGSTKDLSFRVEGEVVEVFVEVGDLVERGTVVARLDPTDYRIDVREARASVQEIRANKRNDDAAYERTRALYEQEGASKEELDVARATAEGTAASLEAAIERLRLCFAGHTKSSSAR